MRKLFISIIYLKNFIVNILNKVAMFTPLLMDPFKYNTSRLSFICFLIYTDIKCTGKYYAFEIECIILRKPAAKKIYRAYHRNLGQKS